MRVSVTACRPAAEQFPLLIQDKGLAGEPARLAGGQVGVVAPRPRSPRPSGSGADGRHAGRTEGTRIQPPTTAVAHTRRYGAGQGITHRHPKASSCYCRHDGAHGLARGRLQRKLVETTERAIQEEKTREYQEVLGLRPRRSVRPPVIRSASSIPPP
jgi:hypothetical protein